MLSFNRFLKESITLKYHATLNRKLFDDSNALLPDVRNKLIEIAKAWQDYANIPNNIIENIIMTGGNAAYNYTKYSDIDIHLIINRKKLSKDSKIIEDYLSMKKSSWASSYHILVKGYTVELYAQDISDNLVAAGVYSLTKNEWIKKPIHGNYNFSKNKELFTKVEEIKDTILTMIENNYSEADFKIMKDKLKNMRNAALQSGNEFSFENLVFKELRNEGILDKMNSYFNKLKVKKLSL